MHQLTHIGPKNKNSHLFPFVLPKWDLVLGSSFIYFDELQIKRSKLKYLFNFDEAESKNKI